ncbi:MAG: D-glycero-beta-D-manno-heptose-7-phosphate kinase [Blastocatellia bacterium]
MKTISRTRAESILTAFKGRKIVVIGDLMLDEFIWGRVRRISPEAPVPVVEIERQTLSLGGAGNVASNLSSLGARPVPIGVLGDDDDARRLCSALKSSGLSAESLVVDPGRPTTLKTRIIAHNQQIVRADRENRGPISGDIEERVVKAFERELESADAVVVSDYNKGLLTASVLDRVLKVARERGRMVCLDPKSRDFSHYQPVTIITPNHKEALEAAGSEDESEDGVIQAGTRILGILQCSAVLVTRGEEGMSLFTDDGEIAHIATAAREVFDVTGAGDTVIATLGLAIASGASPIEAAILANHAAGVVVGKVGTATVTRQELLSSIS